MKITADFNKNILNVTGIMGNLKADIARSLEQSASLVKKNIVAELRSPNKSGTEVGKSIISQGRRIRRFSSRRSAKGESLARDTGRSEKLIDFEMSGSKSVEVGFKSNPQGFDYVAYQELEKDRPTMQKAIANSIEGINNIFEKNLTPK